MADNYMGFCDRCKQRTSEGRHISADVLHCPACRDETPEDTNDNLRDALEQIDKLVNETGPGSCELFEAIGNIAGEALYGAATQEAEPHIEYEATPETDGELSAWTPEQIEDSDNQSEVNDEKE